MTEKTPEGSGTLVSGTSLTNAKDVLDLLAKLLIVAAGIVYILGFIVVHTRYRGMLPLGPLRVEYIAAGLVFLALEGMPVALTVSLFSTWPGIRGKRGPWNRNWLVVAALFAYLAGRIVFRSGDVPVSSRLAYLGSVIYLTGAVGSLLRARSSDRPAVIWALPSGVLTLPLLAGIFGSVIYPNVRRELGGGAPIPALVTFSNEVLGKQLGLRCNREGGFYEVGVLAEIGDYIWLEDTCAISRPDRGTRPSIVRVQLKDLQALVFPGEKE